jgi:2-polyprenyl-6-hydroxyphenyl methylase/3-demethylubiquinone-9 3-methyltransferase
MSSNIRNFDPSEISKFEELAHRWWDPHSEFKPLHDINPLRLAYVCTRVALSGKRVLDVGCGAGLLAESMALEGAHVIGIDLGEAPLEVARLHSVESQLEIDYRHTTAEQLMEQEPQSYDVVTCMEMLEHVPDPSSTVAACGGLIKAGGHVFFSTINRNFKSFAFAIIGAEYILNLLPKGTHEYAKFIRPSELSRWCRLVDLRLEDLTGMTYHPLTRAYRLSDDVDVNYLVHAVKG